MAGGDRQSGPGRVGGAAEAASLLRPGDRVLVGSAWGRPGALVEAVTARGGALADLELMQMGCLAPESILETTSREGLRLNLLGAADAWGIGGRGGFADATPLRPSSASRMMRSGRLRVDAALVSLTPPDGRGRCGLGLNADITLAAVRSASRVIGQVNAALPDSRGAVRIPLSSLHAFIEHDEAPPPERPADAAEADEAEIESAADAIAETILELIREGAPLQVGVGPLCSAVTRRLAAERSFEVHTDTLTDATAELLLSQAGGGWGRLHGPGRGQATMGSGGERVAEALQKPGLVELRSSERMGRPGRPMRRSGLVAINAAERADLSGAASRVRREA
jgi:acyl-CoA hydrolase